MVFSFLQTYQKSRKKRLTATALPRSKKAKHSPHSIHSSIAVIPSTTLLRVIAISSHAV